MSSAGVVVNETTFQYDAVGNILSESGTAGDRSFTYNAADQLLESDGVVYHMTQLGIWSANTTTTTVKRGVLNTMHAVA